MPKETLLRTSTTFLCRARVAQSRLQPAICQLAARHAHTRSIVGGPAIASSSLRPHNRAVSAPWLASNSAARRGRRTIFIQTQDTPNIDALKFVPNHQVIPANVSTPYIEYLNPRSTIAPPYPSPLAAQLMSVDGVKSVFYSADCITVTKAADANWAHIKPEVYSLITETITSGQPIVNVTEAGSGGGANQQQQVEEEDSLAYNENDSEVVGMIKELLETRIRPRIQEDGGDIEYRGFDDDGNVMLKLRGACRTCDSSTVTLKNGIEAMLMHYIEEVKGVIQITDPEEDIALHEFAKFEEKLKAQKGSIPPSTIGKGSLDTVPG